MVRRFPVGWIAPVALVGLWELLVGTGLVSFKNLPSVVDVARALGSLAGSGELASNTGHTVVVAVISWAIASAVGILLGLLIGLSTPVWKGCMASVDILRALPIIALVPVGVIIFGLTERVELIIAAYAAVWPVVLNTIEGVRQTRQELLDVGRMLEMSKLRQVWKLILPSALPLILVGLRLGLGLSLILAVVTEIVGTPHGVGFALVQEEQALQPAKMFAYIVIIGAVGYILNALLVGGAWLVSPADRSSAKGKP